jgi:hypothetical protein
MVALPTDVARSGVEAGGLSRPCSAPWSALERSLPDKRLPSRRKAQMIAALQHRGMIVAGPGGSRSCRRIA